MTGPDSGVETAIGNREQQLIESGCVSIGSLRLDFQVKSRSFSNDFQMTVETNYAIAIAMLCDWLKNLASVSQPMRCKAKTNVTLNARFSPRRGQVTSIC